MTIPPRLSANGEHGFPIAGDVGAYQAFVDGQLLRGVIAYDMVDGFVEVLGHDETGAVVPGLIRRYYGAVKVVMRD